MVVSGVVPRLLVLLATSSPPALQAAVLRLANNLALDTKTRRQMVAAGLVPRLSAVLLQVQSSSQLQANSATQAGGTASQLQPLALGLLYLASMDHPARSLVAASDLLPRCVSAQIRPHVRYEWPGHVHLRHFDALIIV